MQHVPQGRVIVGDAALTIPVHVTEGSVKLAYLDPPYNTGRQFARYDDSAPRMQWAQELTATVARVHDTLMRSGSIWLHVDDNEHHVARTVLDDVFGAKNFVSNVVWERKKKPSYLHGQLANVLDHILVYAKDKDALSAFVMPDSGTVARVPLAHGGNPQRVLEFPAGAVQFPGEDRVIPAGDQSTAAVIIALMDPVTVRDGVNVEPFRLYGELRWTQATLDEYLHAGVVFRAPKLPVRVNAYVPTAGKIWTTLFARANGMATNEDARDHQHALFGGVAFDTPKPEELLGRIIETATNPGDLVLDPYAGSGSTAAAAHKLGRDWVVIERNVDTVQDFIVPRLQQVVDGSDRGGISTVVVGEASHLPPAFTARDARLAAQWVRGLAKAGKVEGDPEVVAGLVKQLHQASGALERADRWTGGGSFTVVGAAEVIELAG
ncbi:site-specific DNA-methyltransferase [Jonesiaceae bacterium BS-20]|uniref:Site-specific DNA-methyltransferase n=1 Tax=Jonesiaceae bacterium BS-20 TaxID=3120821 RepID=A0AAU7E0E0_9MICO